MNNHEFDCENPISPHTDMKKIVLISNDHHAKACYLESCSIPNFYMGDFSIMGLVVDQFDGARNLLLRSGFAVVDHKNSADIVIDRVDRIGEIRSLFARHGIRVELSDIADTLYQA